MSDTYAVNAGLGTGIDTPEDMGPGQGGTWDFWMAQEQIAEKEEERWVRRARRVIERYRDERNDASGRASAIHKFNILWSNVQTLKPVLYARTPKPVVERRFLDRDPTGRLASTVLERALAYSLDIVDFDTVMNACVEDRLLPGRGTARVLYVPYFGDELTDGPDTPETPSSTANYHDTEEADATVASPGDATPSAPNPAKSNADPNVRPLREVLKEEVRVKYTFWGDYREGPARCWEEVPWVRYQSFMTKDELTRRFGKKIASQVNLDSIGGIDQQDDKRRKVKPPPDVFRKARIYEFWDKDTRKVCWIAPGTPGIILDECDDPLGLPEFFPSPDPLLATTTTDKRVPIPDYTEYQDQADELDLLTARIDILTRALKVAGVYAGSEKQVLQQLFSEGVENKLIAVEDWSGFAQNKGGMDSVIQWLPIKQVAETLVQLCDMRDRSKQIIYEITGIGDIIRGATQPMETATAQRLKANFATRRQVPEQKRVARFARDLIRLMAGVISEHFSSETLSAITGLPELAPVPQVPPPPPQYIPGPSQQPGQPGMMAPNVVPMQPQLAPNPAFAQWQQQMQAAQKVIAENQQKQAEFQAACDLIKADGSQGFRLDIESDSTIALDETEEREARNQFMSALLPVLQQVIPVAQGNPPMAEFAKQFVLFGVRGYPVARMLESSIERLFDSLAGAPPHQPPGAHGKGADPQVEMAKIKQDEQDTQARAQAQNAATQQKAQAASAEIAQKDRALQTQERIAEIKAQTDQQRMLADLAIQQSEAEDDMRRNASPGLV